MAPGLATTVGELALREALHVSQDASLAAVARELGHADVSCAILTEPPLRIVTEHDLARAWAHDHRSESAVGTIATSSPIWTTTETTIVEAAVLMIEHGVRHLVVLDRQRAPAGIVSMRDLFVVLLASHEPAAVFASFATVLLRRTQVDERSRPKG